MKVIIAGGRTYVLTEDDIAGLDWLRIDLPIQEVVCGCASGADSEGRIWADSRDIPIREFPPDWNKHGRAAGPIRNGQMAAYADALVAFPGGRGTADMVKQAGDHGLLVYDWRNAENPRRG